MSDHVGDDPTPHAGSGAPRRSATQLASDPAFTGTYAPIAAGFRPTSRVPSRRTPTTLINFGATGHGFTANGNSQNVNLNDTTVYARGTQSATWATKGAGALASITKAGISSINMTGKKFEVSVRVDDWTHLTNLYLYVGDTSFTNFYVLTLWQTATGRSPVDGGTWSTFTADLSSRNSTTGTPNWAAITCLQITAQDDSTGNPVALRAGHIASVPNSATYPNGVISFTFDDSYASQFTVCRPKLDQYGYQGTFYTITDALDSAGLYMTTSNVRQMNDAAGHEISPHAYTLANHNLTNGFKDLSLTALDQELYQIKQWMVTNRFSGADHFCWPKGLHSDAMDAVAQRYFASVRTTQQFPVEHPQTADPIRLRAYGLNTPVTLAGAKALVDAAMANGSWQVFIAHDVVASPSGSTIPQWDTASFNSLVDYVNAQGAVVRTVGDVLKTSG